MTMWMRWQYLDLGYSTYPVGVYHENKILDNDTVPIQFLLIWPVWCIFWAAWVVDRWDGDSGAASVQ